MLASLNRADEHSPWAIIIRSAPVNPQDVMDMVPATRIPICPTDE